MYYRKYFEGAVENTNIAKYVTIVGTTSNLYCYTNQTEVINNAIKDTLQSVGIAYEYDSETYTLFIKGMPIQIATQYPKGNITVCAGGMTLVQTSTSTYETFSAAGNYKFYVTLKGDPESLLKVTIGTYSNPALETVGFVLTNVVDLRDHSKWIGFERISYDAAYLFKEGGIPHSEINRIAWGQQWRPDNVLSKSSSLIPLTECIDTTGFLKIVNCYAGVANYQLDSFYQIGGEIYYFYSNYIIAKCTTEIP